MILELELFSNVNDCDYIRGVIPDDVEDSLQFITQIQTGQLKDGDVDICCFHLELRHNCCPPIIIPLPITWNIEPTIVSYGKSLDGFEHYIYFRLGDVPLPCIKDSVFYQRGGQKERARYMTIPGHVEPVFRYIVPVAEQDTVRDLVTITLETCGVVYEVLFNVDYALTIINNEEYLIPTLDSYVVTMPTVPSFIEIGSIGVNTFVGVYPEAMAMSDSFLNGIYQVAIVRNRSLSIADELFVNCDGLECDIVNHIVNHPTSEVYTMYRALNYALECSKISYVEMCNLWYYIQTELGLVQVERDCGCKKK